MSNIYMYLIPALLQFMKIVFNHFNFGSVNPTSCLNFLFQKEIQQNCSCQNNSFKKGDEF